MSDLLTGLSEAASRTVPVTPELFSAATPEGEARLRQLASTATVVSDDFEEQLRELYAYQHPSLAVTPAFAEEFRAHRTAQDAEMPRWKRGNWVFYTWRNALVHVLDDREFQQIRTSRNRNLISEEEQRKFADAVVAVAGLSVGNSIALSIVLSGGANHIRLADFDDLALSNVNRVRSSTAEFGRNKAEMTARQIYELNPYATVDLFTDGLTPENMAAFCDGLTVAIDEIDNLAVKYLLREHVSKLGIPVVMAADNGDDGVVEIERYDLYPSTPFFHGRMGAVTYESLKALDKLGICRTIASYVGVETVAPRMWASLPEIGKTTVSWPQLGGAATLNGAAVAYCVRKIANGQPLEADRALISLDEKFIPGYAAPASREKALAEARGYAKMFGL